MFNRLNGRWRFLLFFFRGVGIHFRQRSRVAVNIQRLRGQHLRRHFRVEKNCPRWMRQVGVIRHDGVSATVGEC